ncbi:alpha/beta fold hydrolase [Mycobacterium sp. URHB0044]|uniref:alpha/beta fold hydrolase n=1 Tax=Mycobacterium sp. URHB0044 TaxID=1380386 RepID=UPI00048CC8D4|nr:alpha/beta fold hydrolase [Mycobacterium sp. URHB0044]
MTGPETLDVVTPDVTLRALTWGPDDGPVALCLHGFPDTAHGWRKVAPVLADAGWRVVAPFMRGYAPSSASSDGSYHVGALMDDALRVLDAAGPTGRDVVIGHDWGAIAGTGLAAMPDSPFSKAVIMSVPPAASFRRIDKVFDAGRLLARLPRQLLRSWYIMFFQLPGLPERSASWVVPRLWRQWSPGYTAHEDVSLVLDAIGAPANWRAALGYYRATIRGSKPPPRYAELHEHWLSAPTLPALYLHGTDDGCASPDYAEWVKPVLPNGSRVEIVDGAGHFMQLDRPDVVARHILDFVGRA